MLHERFFWGQIFFLCQNLFQVIYNHNLRSNVPLNFFSWPIAEGGVNPFSQPNRRFPVLIFEHFPYGSCKITSYHRLTSDNTRHRRPPWCTQWLQFFQHHKLQRSPWVQIHFIKSSQIFNRIKTNPNEAHCRHFRVVIEGRLVKARSRQKTKWGNIFRSLPTWGDY